MELEIPCGQGPKTAARIDRAATQQHAAARAHHGSDDYLRIFVSDVAALLAHHALAIVAGRDRAVAWSSDWIARHGRSMARKRQPAQRPSEDESDEEVEQMAATFGRRCSALIGLAVARAGALLVGALPARTARRHLARGLDRLRAYRFRRDGGGRLRRRRDYRLDVRDLHQELTIKFNLL